MAKPLKITAWIFGGLLLLLLAAAIALPLLFDPNDYRSDLSAAVKKQTGRSFAVGHIKLAVLPWLRVSMSNVLLGNAEGFSAMPMLSIKEAEVGVRLWPLITGTQLRADTIKLSGLRATLEVNAEGVSNWADLLERQRQQADTAPKNSKGNSLSGLDLAGIAITDAALSYNDAQKLKHYEVEGLRLRTGRVHGAEPFDFDTAASIKSTAPSLSANAEATGTLAWDAASSSARLSALKARVKAALTPATPGKPLAVDAVLTTALLNYDGASRVLTTAPVTLGIASLTQGAADTPALTAKGPVNATLSFDLAQQRYSAKGFTAELELGGSSLPGGKPQAVTLAGELAADLAAHSASLQGMSLAAFGLNANAGLKLEGLGGDAASISGPLTLAPFEPRKLMAALGMAAPKTADASVLNSAQLSTQLNASSKALRLDALTLTLDQTTFTGSAAVADFEPLSYAFKLNADTLDADRYLPPRVVHPAGEAPVKRVDVKSAEIPVEMLQKLNAEGTLNVGKLTLKGVALTDALLRLSGNLGAARPQQRSATLYGGRADVGLEVFRAGQPALAIRTAQSK